MEKHVEFSCEDLITPDFLGKLLPFLSFGEIPPSPPIQRPPEGWRETIISRGFVRELPLAVWGEFFPGELSALSAGLTRLAELGLPLGILCCSAEAGAVASSLLRFVREAMQDERYASLGDWAFFHVDSTKEGSRGWPPHRDRMTVQNALDSAGAPQYITCWMPLSSATPYTSCLYFLPREHDPGFETGEEAGVNPVVAAFSSPESFQHICGLPTARGGLVAFSSRTLHWGSAPLKSVVEGRDSRPPRQALSIAFATPAFEAPALLRRVGEPSYLERVLLLCGQGLLYHAQAPLKPQVAKVFLEVLQRHGAGLLDEEYKKRAEKAGAWVTFSASFSSQRGESSAPPSAEEIALCFAARAGTDGGFDASQYI